MRPLVPLLACALAGCAMRAPIPSVPAQVQPAQAVPTVTDLNPYFDLLEELTRADAARAAALLGELQAQLAQAPGSRPTLRYAVALGSAGHKASDPVEARRLLQGLLASPGDLGPAELRFASALLREFDARVILYAQLARQREEAEGKLAASNEAHARALQSNAAETARLRRALAQAEQKLQAITEMERELLEQVEATPPVEP
jgi:hypothetical protein